MKTYSDLLSFCENVLNYLWMILLQIKLFVVFLPFLTICSLPLYYRGNSLQPPTLPCPLIPFEIVRNPKKIFFCSFIHSFIHLFILLCFSLKQFLFITFKLFQGEISCRNYDRLMLSASRWVNFTVICTWKVLSPPFPCIWYLCGFL